MTVWRDGGQEEQSVALALAVAAGGSRGSSSHSSHTRPLRLTEAKGEGGGSRCPGNVTPVANCSCS